MRDANQQEISGIDGFAKEPVLLLVCTESIYFNAAVFGDEMARRGFRVHSGSGIPGQVIPTLVAIAISTTATKDTLDSSFSLARWSQEQRSTSQAITPITIVNCSRNVPASVRADFFRYGCHVMSQATPEQVADHFDTLLIDAKRSIRRGITITFRNHQQPIMTYAGREAEIPATGRLLRLLLTLCRERREFSAPELAAILDCKTDQVKVRVDRLRRLVVGTGRKLGISFGKQEVVRNSGKKGGYFVHANVIGRFSTNAP